MSTADAVSTVERLCVFMGWERHEFLGLHCWGPRNGMLNEMRFLPTGFSPFTDANHDLQVLERAREAWAADSGAATRMDDALEEAWLKASWQWTMSYRCGDYSRAVLTVLRSTEGEKP